jgi:GDP-4-dehydro-6-deoxy-D-mannose reductase
VRFLITGIGGFVGRHLSRALLDAGHGVFGLVRRRGSSRVLEELHRLFPERFPGEAVIIADVLDPRAVRGAIAEVRPDGLFHLAAVSSVPASEGDPLAAYRTNFFGTLNVLRSVGEVYPGCRVLHVGSGDAYGASGNEVQVLTESAALQPVSPYGVSKAAADLAAFQWHWSGKGEVVRARPFNHTGPGQEPVFVCSDFACQIAKIERGERPPVLEVGNLDAERDLTDVRDVAAGYLALWERGAAGEAYNLCSGRGVHIRTVVEELCRRSRVPVEVRVAEARRRSNEVLRLVGSFSKAQAHTGWQPTISLGRILDDLLDYWRGRLGGGT